VAGYLALVTRRRQITSLVLLLAGCRAERPSESDVVYDAAGLPDCAATYDEYDVCVALEDWHSRAPEGFADPAWTPWPVRWIGTEGDDYFCADDAADAEAYVLEHAPDDGGTHVVDAADPRWFDVVRYDAAGAGIERARVTRCDFFSYLAAAPPGVEAEVPFAQYAGELASDDDFSSVMREMMAQRASRLTVQVILSWGEAVTESRRLRTCAVHCGDCEDPFGPWRDVTGVLESTDWVLDVASGEVTFTPTEHFETACTVRY
jgi:hypothetical protein